MNTDCVRPEFLEDVYAGDARDRVAFVHYVLRRVGRGAVLSEGDAERMMRLVLAEHIGLVELVAYLKSLAVRGASVDELVGSARALRAATAAVHVPSDVADTCGTGGDHAMTFNISTVAALVAAAAGQPIVKHGNHSSSGGVGSADLIEALGLPIDLCNSALVDSLDRHRFAFLFAPRFRPAAHRIREARRRIPCPSLFNLLGPLCNPARPAFQLIGTFHESAARTLAEAVSTLGTSRSFVVVGPDGVDELIPQEGNLAWEVVDGTVRQHRFDANHAGLEPCAIEDLSGGDAEHNAQVAVRVLRGQRCAPRDAVIMNAGLVLLTAGRVESLREGCVQAADAIDRGAASELLDALKANVRISERNS